MADQNKELIQRLRARTGSLLAADQFSDALLCDEAADALEEAGRVDWSAITHAAHEWANLSACSAAKRGGPWRQQVKANESRNQAKTRFLAAINSQKDR